MSRPVPHPDLVTAPYWQRVDEGVFALPRCEVGPGVVPGRSGTVLLQREIAFRREMEAAFARPNTRAA